MNCLFPSNYVYYIEKIFWEDVTLYQTEVDEAASAPNVRNSFYSITILGANYQ